MSRAHNFANIQHEDDARYTTRSFSKRGLSKRAKRVKHALNHAAKVADHRIAMKEAKDQASDEGR